MSRSTFGYPRAVAAGLVALDVLCVAGRRDQAKFRAGGTAGNVAAILGSMGWPSEVLGPSEGSPGFQMLLEDLTRCGVEYHGVLAGAVPVIIEELHAQATHRFLFDCPECGRALPRYRRARVEQWSALRDLVPPDVFFTDRLSDDLLTLARRAKERGAFVVYEPSDPSDEPWAPSMFGLVDMVKYASDRAGLLPWLDAAGAFEICTRGADGLEWRWPARGMHEWHWLPPERVDIVVDTCGAGDWLTAGILIGLMEAPLVDSQDALDATVQVLRQAQRLAAWSCRFEGARGALYADGPIAARAILNNDRGPGPRPLGDSPSFTTCVVCPN